MALTIDAATYLRAYAKHQDAVRTGDIAYLKEAYEVLSAGADRYSTSAATILDDSGEPSFTRRMVISAWELGQPGSSTSPHWFAVAAQHQRQYLKYIQANNYVFPSALQVEQSYRDALLGSGCIDFHPAA